MYNKAELDAQAYGTSPVAGKFELASEAEAAELPAISNRKHKSVAPGQRFEVP